MRTPQTPGIRFEAWCSIRLSYGRVRTYRTSGRDQIGSILRGLPVLDDRVDAGHPPVPGAAEAPEAVIEVEDTTAAAVDRGL